MNVDRPALQLTNGLEHMGYSPQGDTVQAPIMASTAIDKKLV